MGCLFQNNIHIHVCTFRQDLVAVIVPTFKSDCEIVMGSLPNVIICKKRETKSFLPCTKMNY